MNWVAILGYVMLILFVFLLLKGKISPVTLFILLPIGIALLCGYDIKTIFDYIKTGVTGTTSNAVMFCFAMMFFSVLTSTGVFDPIIDTLIRVLGRNVVGIFIAAGIITVIGHLDESATTTICLTVPFFLPIFRRLKVDVRQLILMIAIAMGVMNLLPWGGPMMRVSLATGLEATYLWHKLIPIQVFGMVTVLAMSIYFGVKAQKSESAEIALQVVSELRQREQKKLDWKFFVNLAILVGVLYVLMTTKLTSYIVFMIGTALVMVINFPNQKDQNAEIKKAAPAAFFIIATILSSGVFLGILQGGDNSMLTQMANVLLSIIPPALGKHLHILMGLISAPLGLVFGNDPYLYGVLPLCIEVGSNYGISAEAMGICMAIGKNVAVMGSPVYPSTFLLLGMADLELKDYLKYAFIPMWVISILMVIFGAVVGIYAW